MSTKPTVALARWADLGGSFVTDPTSGERDTGFQDATPAEADKVNALLKQLYLWALYLSDGALTGNHSIAGTLSTTGAATLASASVTGTLAVGGVTTLTGALAANNGAVIPTGKDLTLEGTSDLNHGDRTKMFHPLPANGIPAWGIAVNPEGIFAQSPSGGVLFHTLEGFVVGDRIKSIGIKTAGNGTADLIVDVRYSNGVSTTSIGSVTLTNPSSAVVTTPIDVTDTTIESGGIVWLEFNAGSGMLVGTVSATFDHPPP